ncbi:hypothetical protein WM40_27085, partial [Robbsia andropogonis]
HAADRQPGRRRCRHQAFEVVGSDAEVFRQAAQIIENDHPTLAEKLRQATPHWMRHTHATHAIARGVELSAVRDNLRHASISTTSIYLHTDDVKRARQFGQAFTN